MSEFAIRALSRFALLGTCLAPEYAPGVAVMSNLGEGLSDQVLSKFAIPALPLPCLASAAWGGSHGDDGFVMSTELTAEVPSGAGMAAARELRRE